MGESCMLQAFFGASPDGPTSSEADNTYGDSAARQGQQPYD